MSPEIFQTFARYNAWMNGNVYRGCEKIPDDLRKKDLGAFFKSIHGTLNHMLIGDRFWMARFTGAPLPKSHLNDILYQDFAELWAARQDLDRQIADFCATLTPDWLATPFSFTSAVYQKTFTHPNWYLMMQLFNHQTHHRGQVTTLMMQQGVDPGATDWPVMPAAN
jgi:uncharacterized damage-inducible protein DinB